MQAEERSHTKADLQATRYVGSSHVHTPNDLYKAEILPQIQTAPGLLVLRDMINRETGEGIVSSIWPDQNALKLSTDRNLTLRPQTIARGFTFGEMSFREIVLADAR